MEVRFCSLIIITAVIFLTSCASSKYLTKKESRNLDHILLENPELSRHHLGFILKDVETGKVLKEVNSSKYFTPASNTKILTLSAGLEILGDSIPSFEYYKQNDTLYVKGIGDPTFLHPDFVRQSSLNFLKTTGSVIVLDLSHFADQRYGAGWSWDDFNGAYQVERGALPLYGHVLRFTDYSVDIPYFQKSLDFKGDNGKMSIRRDRFQNVFNVSGEVGDSTKIAVPFIVTDSVTVGLLADTLGKPVHLGKLDSSITTDIWFSHHVDSLYRPMIQESNNFYADQILLMSGYRQFGTMRSKMVIDWMKSNVLNSPDELLWIDGSGLSRYNLFTPRSMVHLLERLRNKYGEDRILNILPQGGVSGTIESWYSSDDGNPYIYAKTGTLRNNHSLSGFIRGDTGKLYVFSFMNNNFPGSSTTVKIPMQKILEFLKRSL
ncbi:MAG: D-alanyl-D-alanine carboxypeptidase [Bacteroidia bacterium]|nr:D-alanyl-D-alanine carboxypeptidase [Bacteroidia bacterium]